MTRILLALLFVLPLVACAQQGAAITDNGHPLSHPTITKFDGMTFTVEHDGGIAHVPWEQMPPSFRGSYQFDPDRARDAKMKEAAQALNVHQIREMETDPLSFVGKRFSIQGTIDVASYYNYEYRDAQATHYAFKIKDGTGSCYAYMPKAQAEQLRATILSDAPSKREPQTFVCMIIPARYNKKSNQPLLELLAYGPDTSVLIQQVRR